MSDKQWKFQVETGIDIWARNEYEAAGKAWACMQDSDSPPFVFTVTKINESGEPIGQPVVVDLWYTKSLPRNDSPELN